MNSRYGDSVPECSACRYFGVDECRKKLTYRVYGPSYGYGSFRTLARGFVEGLKGLGREVSFFPIDLDGDEEEPTDGVRADVAIYVGYPTLTTKMLKAKHRARYVMVAPNSSRTSPRWFNGVGLADAKIITPSKWAREMLLQSAPKELVDLGIDVVPHGLLSEFDPAQRLDYDYSHEGVHFLHVTSSIGDRKSTRAVIEAFSHIVSSRGTFNGTLAVVCDGSAFDTWYRAASPQILVVTPRSKNFAHVYRCNDFIVQPSRAEGFGMVPMEALACGVPVIATACTGQADYLPAPGAVIVPHGPYDDIDDHEDSMAPTVDVDDVERAMVDAMGHASELRAAAAKNASAFYEAWKWSSAIKPWIQKIEGEMS